MDSRPLRILSVWESSDIVGGGEILEAELARVFSPARVDYRIGCIDSPHAWEFFQRQGLKVFSINPRKNGLFETLRSGGFDLVETAKAGPWLGEMAKRLKIPFLWKVTVDPCLFNCRPRAKKYLLTMQQLAQQVTVLSQRFLPSPGSPFFSKFRVVPAGVDVHLFDPKECFRKRLTFRQRFGISPSTFAVGMVANFYPRKCHLDFIRAARHVLARHPYVRFLIFGNRLIRHRWRPILFYRFLVRQLILQLGLSRQVSLHPFYPDRVGLAAGLDLAVLPSIGDGHPMALLDAMAAGTPVIGTDSGGIPDLIEHNRTGVLIPPRNPKELAEAISDLVAHPERAHALGAAGQCKVQREFDIRHRVVKQESLYSELIRVEGLPARALSSLPRHC